MTEKTSKSVCARTTPGPSRCGANLGSDCSDLFLCSHTFLMFFFDKRFLGISVGWNERVFASSVIIKAVRLLLHLRISLLPLMSPLLQYYGLLNES